MKTVQKLYEKLLRNMQIEKGLFDNEVAACGLGSAMANYHSGKLLTYKEIADILVRDFNCVKEEH